jgi:ubiquitin-protein ligase
MAHIKRIMHDLLELEQSKPVGVNAKPINDDLTKLRCIVTGSDGLYSNIPILFDLEFPINYPHSPPSAFFVTDVRYLSGASYKSPDGRLVVCLNIFGNFGNIHTEWASASSGWSPTMSLETILVAVQGLMMDDMLSKSPGDIQRTKDSNVQLKEKGIEFPIVYTLDEFVKVHEKLSIDMTKQLTPFDTHYICGITHQSVTQGAIIGYGISVEKTNFSSPCEYISKESFFSGIRSSTNKAQQIWIPIIIKLSKFDINLLKESFKQLITHSHNGNNTIKIIKVFSSIMNNLVVEIMNSKMSGKINDKFIDGYFMFYRLFNKFIEMDTNAQSEIEKIFTQFINFPEKRNKTNCSNLGELLIMLLMSKKYTWSDIAYIFQEECDARNFMWYAIGNRSASPKYPELKNDKCLNRAPKVFNATEISRNLVMYQVKFYDIATKVKENELELSFCLIPETYKIELRDIYNKIKQSNNWNDYFGWLKMSTVTDDIRSTQLITAMNISLKFGYHK